CRETMPDVKVFNIVDESLINNTIAANQLTPVTARRLAGYIQSAEEAGADAVMVTCSSVGPAVEAARPFVSIPVMRVDQAMADLAVATGRRIGVIATLATTLGPTSELVRARAEAQGREVEIVPRLCEGAFQAVISGDTETHDRIVMAGLKELMGQVDVVVLAQASMARVADALPADEKIVPILASPRLGVEAAKQMMDGLSET
ncbi:MAG TPA: aspartate/glutamate racemase family protein, partial [Ardenticatenaceae bacterium]|nr:aspartate/glutamate racemase family protein [Ardenticatenaceae bacterium]